MQGISHRHAVAAFARNPDTSLGGQQVGTAMKMASFENVLTLATLVIFAVFLGWSAKIIVAWA